MDFSGLFSVEIEPGQGSRNLTFGEKAPTNGASLRVFSDGSVYASKKFAEHLDIEYKNEDVEEQYGLDVVRTDKWGAYNGDKHFILVARIPRNSPKIDLFGTIRSYDDFGRPKTSVTTQGSAKFGLQLLEMLSDIYNFELVEDQDFVDLHVHTEQGITSPNNVYNLPKKINKGAKAGEWTFQRRENLILYPLSVMEEGNNQDNHIKNNEDGREDDKSSEREEELTEGSNLPHN